MYGQNLANNISAQQQARGIDTAINTGLAARAAIAQTGVDLGLGRFMSGGDAARTMLGGSFGKSVTRGAAAGAGRGAVEEGIAEVIQTGFERGQAGLDLGSSAAAQEYGTSFLMGAALGGGMGAVSGGLAAASDARQAQRNSPEAIRQSGAEGRLRALMAEQEADAAYNLLTPSPIASSLEGLGDTISRVVGGEMADGRQASRLIRDRQQGELLALPAPDPMAYDPSGVVARPATQEEIILAQQTGGAPGIAPVLALPNPNAAPVQVSTDGTAVRTDDARQVTQLAARELPPEREQ
jgi:hypothetical protein